VIAGIFLLVLAAGAIAAGRGYVQTARRMRAFATTRGTVTARGVTTAPGGDTREGRYGQGGGYQPHVTYDYEVGGVAYTSDRWSYATRGLKRSLAEETAAAVPGEVEVHYDAAKPQEAYLHTHTPRLGYWLVALGVALALIGLVALLG
jgi:Protein of unknown function (DUF3592)